MHIIKIIYKNNFILVRNNAAMSLNKIVENLIK